MGLERRGGRIYGYRPGWVRIFERITVDEDILVRGTTSFGRDDMGIVSGCDLVDYAYQAFVPSILVVIIGCRRTLLFR